MVPETDLERVLLESIKARDIVKITQIIKDNPKINLNCKDQDEFTPLQHACHLGDVDMINLLLDKGANINLARKKDGYTALMLAAIGNRLEAVQLLLERGADKMSKNCVNRTASDMAAFVALDTVSATINCWLPYDQTIKPFTSPMNLEDKPRLSSKDLAVKLHRWIVLPTLHPVKLLFYFIQNPELIREIDPCAFVLDKLASKYVKPPLNEDNLSLKFHYLAELLRSCDKNYRDSENFKKTMTFDEKEFQIFLLAYLRRLCKRDSHSGSRVDNMPKLNDLILKSLHNYPYNSATYQSLQFALSKLKSLSNSSAMSILTQTIDIFGPRRFGRSEKDCEICNEGENNKKCSLCKKVYYCGPNCQKLDWPRHKKCCITTNSTGGDKPA